MATVSQPEREQEVGGRVRTRMLSHQLEGMRTVTIQPTLTLKVPPTIGTIQGDVSDLNKGKTPARRKQGGMEEEVLELDDDIQAFSCRGDGRILLPAKKIRGWCWTRGWCGIPGCSHGAAHQIKSDCLRARAEACYTSQGAGWGHPASQGPEEWLL